MQPSKAGLARPLKRAGGVAAIPLGGWDTVELQSAVLPEHPIGEPYPGHRVSTAIDDVYLTDDLMLGWTPIERNTRLIALEGRKCYPTGLRVFANIGQRLLYVHDAQHRASDHARDRVPKCARVSFAGRTRIAQPITTVAAGVVMRAMPAGRASVRPSAFRACDLATRDGAGGTITFDGERDLGVANVVVRDGMIETVAADAQVPQGLPVVDGSGKTLLPGLIDAHVHAWGEAQRDMLRFGVTSALDMHGDAARLPALRTQRDATANPGLAEEVTVAVRPAADSARYVSDCEYFLYRGDLEEVVRLARSMELEAAEEVSRVRARTATRSSCASAGTLRCCGASWTVAGPASLASSGAGGGGSGPGVGPVAHAVASAGREARGVDSHWRARATLGQR